MQFLNKKAFRLVALFSVLMLLFVTVAAFAHTHADSLYHKDCPLCRFQMDGNYVDEQVSVTTLFTDYTCIRTIPRETTVPRPVEVSPNSYPNAPPV